MLVAAVFFQIGSPGRLPVTPVREDLEMVLGAKRGSESRDEVPALERIARDDAQAACKPICH